MVSSRRSITARERCFLLCRRSAAGVCDRVRFGLCVAVGAVSRAHPRAGASSGSHTCSGAAANEGRPPFHTSGVNPGEVQTGLGTRVMFVNNDTIAHDIMGGPDPTRPDCREIDSVGFSLARPKPADSAVQQARLCESTITRTLRPFSTDVS